MSSLTNLHATTAVNSLLRNMLPGSSLVNTDKKRSKRDKGSKAQMIDHNLKKRTAIQERNVQKIKRKEKKVLRKKIAGKKEDQEKIEQKVKLAILRKHQESGNLTDNEKRYLDKLMKRNIKNLKTWDLEEEDELLDLQSKILTNTDTSSKARKTKSRKQKKKDFKEKLSTTTVDHRYQSLTPGLAPVGASDEEDSEEEDY